MSLSICNPVPMMEERQESRNRTIGQLSDMFDREIAGTEDGTNFDLANPGGKEEKAQPGACLLYTSRCV